MSSDPSGTAIVAEGLGKAYELGEQTSLFRFIRGSARHMHWALERVSFEVRHGEAVGIIGHNGAGKSTLLKLLARITEPTCGKATIFGRIASLLEVGTGFHPELTGRENIAMNGSILGMKRAEIARHFDEIVDFAGVAKFIDTPVKRYSSGMQMRLAFSVAAHLQPEILIVDEVLAVGDVQFQKKCMGKMGDVSRSGRTVLFVSHNMAAVRQLTTRCLLMSRGNIVFDGDSNRAIELYADAMAATFTQAGDLSDWPRRLSKQDRVVEFRSLTFNRQNPLFAANEEVSFEVRMRARDPIDGVRVSGTIFHAEGYPIGSFFSHGVGRFLAGEERVFRVCLAGMNLSPGSYNFGLAAGVGDEMSGHRDFDIIMEVLPFEVAAIEGEDGTVAAWSQHWGAIRFRDVKMLEVNDG